MDECGKLQEALSALLDGELPNDRREEIQAHLDSCEACGRTVAQWRKLGVAARDVATPGDERWEQAWGLVERAMADRRASLRLSREIRRGVVVAAIAASILVAAFFWSPRSPVISVTGPRPSEFEVISIETAPGYTPVVVMPQGKDLPVIWVENMEQIGSGDDRS